VQKRRNKMAAKQYFRKLLKGQRQLPWRLITDKLKSYSAAHREVLPSVPHSRCRPWKAKRRPVVPGSREARLLTRRALAPEGKQGEHPTVTHSNAQYENNQAEVSHKPTRQRERQMRRFKSAGQAQRVLTVYGAVGNLFRLGRHLTRAIHYREFRSRAFCEWQEVTCVQIMA
jgi:putative transposase